MALTAAYFRLGYGQFAFGAVSADFHPPRQKENFPPNFGNQG